MLAGYERFGQIAAAAHWEVAAVDLSEDARAWPDLAPLDRGPLLDLLAGFCVGEARVAEELEPFAVAAGGEAAACLRAQARDEERHARFFDRYADEVAGVPGTDAAARREILRKRLPAPFLGLFEAELRDAARRITSDSSTLGAGIGLYHLLLEGVVFAAGQRALRERLHGLSALPGLAYGLERVIRDERWHIGLGARCLADVGTSPAEAEGLLTEAERCARAWGGVVPTAIVNETLRLHRRRLGAAGLTSAAVTA